MRSDVVVDCGQGLLGKIGLVLRLSISWTSEEMEARGLPISWDTPAARRPTLACLVAWKSSSSILLFLRHVLQNNDETGREAPVRRLTYPFELCELRCGALEIPSRTGEADTPVAGRTEPRRRSAPRALLSDAGDDFHAAVPVPHDIRLSRVATPRGRLSMILSLNSFSRASCRLAPASSFRERREGLVHFLDRADQFDPLLVGVGEPVFEDQAGDGGTEDPREDPLGLILQADEVPRRSGLPSLSVPCRNRSMTPWLSRLSDELGEDILDFVDAALGGEHLRGRRIRRREGPFSPPPPSAR